MVATVNWQRGGTQIDGHAGLNEVIDRGGLEYRVEPVGLVTDDADRMPIRRRVANVRVDPDGRRRVVGFVSDGYEIVPNDEALRAFDCVVRHAGARYTRAGTIDGGRVAYVFADLPEPIEILPGDAVVRSLMFTNSFDGSLPLGFVLATQRLWCSNQLVHARRRGHGFSIRHNANARDRAREAVNLLSQATRAFDRVAERMRAMARTPIDAAGLRSFFQAVAPLAEDEERRRPTLARHERWTRLFETGKHHVRQRLQELIHHPDHGVTRLALYFHRFITDHEFAKAELGRMRKGSTTELTLIRSLPRLYAIAATEDQVVAEQLFKLLKSLPRTKSAKVSWHIQQLIGLVEWADTQLPDCSERVRELINRHVRGEQIKVLLGPIDILSDRFPEEVDKLQSLRAKASRMEHAVRHTITVKLHEDPAFYETMRERLERIINERRDQRIDDAAEFTLLMALRDDIKTGHGADAESLGLPEAAYPFYGVLRGKLSDDMADERQIGDLAESILDSLKLEAVIDWQKKDSVRREMRRKVKRQLRLAGVGDTKLDALTTEILSLAEVRL